ncbi:hypothetical protein F952_01759 [Acinetobacter baylyi DSM 14961 = CIP 107474]|nr:hypothetical protein F952_01759 [Acinetobacter baylyi DSM 14961 = CIP 107474]
MKTSTFFYFYEIKSITYKIFKLLSHYLSSKKSNKSSQFSFNILNINKMLLIFKI